MIFAIYRVIDLVLYLWSLAIIGRVLVSWLNISPYNPIVQFLYQVTEPILAPLRRYIPPIGMLDVTPMVALVLIWIVQRILPRLLFSLFPGGF